MRDPTTTQNRFAHLTSAQRDAVTTVGRSLLVSAAAGAGKTTVLAERCAYLVCDLPEGQRCGVDELLVVTFTDAAASEMRSRIRAAIRQRYKDAPGDAWLEQQLYLLDQASISTIHSFCRTLIQRWFPQADVDPQATVLAGDEAVLLRQEVLDTFFAELYGSESELGRSFQALVDDYGNGNDDTIAQTLLRLHDFVNSLPDPEGWLKAELRRADPDSEASPVARLDEHQHARLLRELDLQAENAQHAVMTIKRCWPVATNQTDWLVDHLAALEAWQARMDDAPVSGWEAVAQDVRGYALSRVKPRPRDATEDQKADYESAGKVREEVKKVFQKRLQETLCAFTRDELRDGLTRTSPYVSTLIALATELDQRYRDAKRAQAAVDFNDLQRFAHRLLTVDGDADRPSEVATQLQRRYRHVLVDEFQDVDPLQEAILRLVSRETQSPPEGNLFAVGDIKQSIYRFRLAEPKLFGRRATLFDGSCDYGRLIPLSDNFRSREEVIESVNAVFESLMSESFGGCAYDDAARLRAGATYPVTCEGTNARQFGRPAVELHLLEPVIGPSSSETEEGPDEEDLEGIEREAFLIGRRIKAWMGDNKAGLVQYVADKPVRPGGPPSSRPIEYRDIVILLRSMPHKAEPIADVLRRMSIPVLVGRDDHSIDSTEFRDVFSLLSLLDNQQQDIPLAALLRSPLLATPLNESDLLTIRLIDREVPFYEAAHRYAHKGKDADLRQRLAHVLTRLAYFRERSRRRPVAELLWDVYEENHYLAYVSGLPDGGRRRSHLIRLHELARQFGQFHRQGLPRFLHFLEQMVERDRPIEQAASASNDNAVRVMTIHTSKGLEFPVVILADLHKAFNLQDSRDKILLDRQLGIGMRVADPEQRIMYPTLAHQIISEHLQREDLSESLRVFYVAMTRAREHLMLIGRVTTDRITRNRIPSPARSSQPSPILMLQLETATNTLDWLLPIVGRLPAGMVGWPEDLSPGNDPLIRVHTYDRATTDAWRIPPAAPPEGRDALARLAALDPLPDSEPLVSDDDPEVSRTVATLETEYEALVLTTIPARASVTELKRRWDSSWETDERPATIGAARGAPARPAFMTDPEAVAPVERGLAMHRFLQCLDMTQNCDEANLDKQRKVLIEAGVLTRNDASVLDVASVAWLMTTEVGRDLRTGSEYLEREVPFVSRIPPEDYDPLVSGYDERDWLLVRGTIDLLMPTDEGLVIVDYKTDVVTGDEATSRAEHYRPQLDTYAKAVEGIYGRPVTRRVLVFLHARRIIDLD